MTTQVCSVVPETSKSDEVVRRTANFHPSIWGDRFINYNKDELHNSLEAEEAEKLKEAVKEELLSAAGNSLHQLEIIDLIERLGVAYHFEREIEEALEYLYDRFSDQNDMEDDLYFTSLCFRLLRQHGHKVSCDVFRKFKDEEDNFKENLTDDVRGMLAFYEAAHLGIHGEEILDEAITFTTTHLKSKATSLSGLMAAQVVHALKQPLHRGVPRLEHRRFISAYEEEPSHNQTLLKFAKLDFNMVQSLHKEELAEITRWWKDLDFARKLSFARDRVVECYFWIVGVYYEPKYSLARKILTKVISMTSIIDDIYDVYGTLDELVVFTEAIDRFDKVYLFEQERGHAASAVECYTKEHGVPEEEACKVLQMEVVKAWKDINEECLKPTAVPMPLLTRILNLTRVIDVIYKDEDCYTHVGKVMKSNVASVLIHPVPI
ncbi:hypothetical protein Tsubulata_016800 [Turnera subulata]|uniref:Uncharacterized protein n=1 Tax=Turnera subulata TaxID=218843 RepID=A0A9Q0J410_9ROSI|nr:hypothetical protein Tsubulata_016800 [Turnera subulata]